MNVKNIKLWIAALRSGKYRQGQSFLTQKDPDSGKIKHCCLGIATLCHIRTCPKDVKYEKFFTEDCHMSGTNVRYYYNVKDKNDPETAVLLDITREWLGITNDLEQELINMNDDGKTFREIADYLEQKTNQ